MAVKVGDFIRMLKGDGTYTLDGQTGQVTHIEDDASVWAKMDNDTTGYPEQPWCVGSVHTEGEHYEILNGNERR